MSPFVFRRRSITVAALALSMACASAPRPVVEAAPSRTTVTPSSAETFDEGQVTCAPVEVLAPRWGRVSQAHAELLRSSFEALARGEPAPAFQNPDSPAVALARRLRVCPTTYDGEYVTFDAPELRSMRMEISSRVEPGGASHEVLSTDWADEALQARATVEALRAWLDSHPGSTVETTTDSYLRATWIRRADGMDLCLEPLDEHGPRLAGTTSGACWSITPAPAAIALLSRVEPPYRDDEEEGAAHEVRAFVRLDGAAHALRDGALHAETVRLARDERWSVASDAVPGARFTFAPLAAWDGPVLSGLEPRRLDDQTLVGEHLFCHRDDGTWACADPAAAERIGYARRVDAAGTSVWVTASRSDGGSESSETSTALHLLTREGSALVHRGSLGIAFTTEEIADDMDDEEALAGSDAETATWSWTVDGECLTIAGASVERRWTISARPARGRRAEEHRSAGEVSYAARVDHLPVFAVTSDRAGVVDGSESAGADAEDDDTEDDAGSAPVELEDRRGSWRLEAHGWARAESCE